MHNSIMYYAPDCSASPTRKMRTGWDEHRITHEPSRRHKTHTFFAIRHFFAHFALTHNHNIMNWQRSYYRFVEQLHSSKLNHHWHWFHGNAFERGTAQETTSRSRFGQRARKRRLSSGQNVRGSAGRVSGRWVAFICCAIILFVPTMWLLCNIFYSLIGVFKSVRD